MSQSLRDGFRSLIKAPLLSSVPLVTLAIGIGLNVGMFTVVNGMGAQSPVSAPYWPGVEWRTATPESQGLDSEALASAIDQVRQQHWGSHSLLVIRHGFVVAAADFYPYRSTAPHDVASVTKTITSTLTGVAVANGALTLDRKVLSFFPAEGPADADARKRAITVENLLRMESGLDCGFLPGEPELEQMKRSANWVQFALALPMKNDPATRPSYCSPGYHVLGSVIGAAARTSELEFARHHLFDPLQIKDVVWGDDPQGRSHGWGDSHFYPADLARLGYLYLHGGEWNGKQIVPREWVTMSTAPTTVGRNQPGGFGVEWNAANGANGRQYGGTGRGGQTLIVWPELDTIVVSMAGGNAGQLTALVRQSVKSDRPLPENAAGVTQLRNAIAAAATPPAATAVAPLPTMAAAISGKVFHFPINPSRIDSLALAFAKDGAAAVDLAYYGDPLHIPIGLDGVYRVGPYGPFRLPAGATGAWASDTEFRLDVNFIANINHYTLAMRFQPDQTVEVTVDEASGLMKNGKIIGTPGSR
jgi:CubicO group peptidase (beta-lactamase class C family)